MVKDRKGNAIFAHTIPQKGVDADGYSVARLVEDIKWLGYTKLLLRSDNEAAIVSLLAVALRRLKTEGIVQVAREKPPDYDSRASGSIENAVKQVQGLLRTVKFGFEKHLGGFCRNRIQRSHGWSSMWHGSLRQECAEQMAARRSTGFGADLSTSGCSR